MVELDGQQAKHADQLAQGDIIRIQNLRAKVGLDGKFSAKIGGGDNLIRKLDAEADDSHVIELLKYAVLCIYGACF